MELSADQRKKFEKLLDLNWKGEKKCPICLNKNWAISDRFFELREHAGKAIPKQIIAQPLVVMTCDKCGYTMLFNAILIGLIPRSNQKNGEEKKEENKTKEEKV